MLHYGVIHYYDSDARERPDVVLDALSAFEAASPYGPPRFQGMLHPTDRWSRLKRLTQRAVDQLRVDLKGGVYSSIIGVVGDDELGGTLAISSMPDGDFAHPFSVTFAIALAEETRLSDIEPLALRLWDICGPAAGAAFAADAGPRLSAELSTIPITVWREPTNHEEEARLFELQGYRDRFGDIPRVGWDTFLGSKLVERLGGLPRLAAEAPASSVHPISRDGVCLKLSDSPLLLATPGYRKAVAALSNFLAPVLPPDP